VSFVLEGKYMKEFEKWWEKIGQYEFSTYLTKEQSKIVWKAALEWIYYKGVLDPSLAGDLIKEELPDGSI